MNLRSAKAITARTPRLRPLVPWALALAIALALAGPARSQGDPGAPSQPASESSPAAPQALPVLTLQDAEAQALTHHHRLAASVHNAEAAAQRVGQSSSTLYPSLDATANFSHSDVFGPDSSSATVVTTQSPGANIPVVVSGDQQGSSRDSLNANLTARQTLLDFSRPHQLEQARQNERVALAELDGIRQDVLLEVRKAWFTAFIDQAVLDIRQQTVANREARLSQARAFYEGGTKARIDVATAESDLAQARLQALQAETQLQVDWVTLNVAMGLAHPAPYRLVLDPDWETAPDLDTEQLVRTAMACRPELRTLQARLRGQIAALRAIGADGLPTLSANATLAGNGSPTPLDGSWSIGVSLNWSLFDGFLRRYQDGEARATARSLAEQFEQQRITVYQEVATRIVQVRQASAQIAAARTALDAASESHRLASARYKVGVGSSLELADAELALSQAQTDLASAANTLRTSRAELTRAVGVEDLARMPDLDQMIELDPIPGVDPERSAP